MRKTWPGRGQLWRHTTPYISLQTRFILIFFLLITIPFLISGLVTYQKYSSSVEENAKTSATELVNHIGLNLDQYVKEIERLTLFPFFDESVLNILKNHSGPNRGPVFHPSDELLKMTLFLSSLTFNRGELEGTFIYANDGSVYRSFESSSAAYWEPVNETWMARVNEAEGGLVLVPPHLNKNFSQPQLVFSIARQIREPATGQILGIGEVNLTTRSLESILSLSDTYKDTRLSIRTAEGFLLYPKLGPAPAPDNLPIPTTTSPAVTAANREGFLTAVYRSNYSGLQINGQIPLSPLHKQADDLIGYTIVISFISLLVAYLLAVTLAMRIVNPIRQIQARMHQVQRGSLEVRANVTRRDEIGDLADGFNRMVAEIERLIKEVYKTQLHLKEAELHTLQSQINPHFLYNTLETINMLALANHQYALSDVVASLGKLLRYTVDNREEKVFLREELLFVEAYLRIQTLRYGDHLHEEIEVDPSLEFCLLPKLILQPLVENAVHFACSERGGDGKVRIVVFQQGQDLFLRVQDSGPGISPERLPVIEAKIYAPDEDEMESRTSFEKGKKGFGLRNIHQRLRLLFGEPYGLVIDKAETEGCSITLRLPLLVEEVGLKEELEEQSYA